MSVLDFNTIRTVSKIWHLHFLILHIYNIMIKTIYLFINSIQSCINIANYFISSPSLNICQIIVPPVYKKFVKFQLYFTIWLKYTNDMELKGDNSHIWSCMWTIINCLNPNSTNSSVQQNLRLDYILTPSSTPPTTTTHTKSTCILKTGQSWQLPS